MSSPLYTRILDDIKTAMKAADKVTLGTLRMVSAAVKDASVNIGKETEDAHVLAVLTKSVKQREDSISQFTAAGRAELAGTEEAEMAVLKRYLPEPLSAAELEALVRKVIAETGAASKKDMGKVMGSLQPLVRGRADGKAVNQLVQALLPA